MIQKNYGLPGKTPKILSFSIKEEIQILAGII